MNSPINAILFTIAIIMGALLVKVFWCKFFTAIVVPMHHRCIHSRHGKLVGLLESGRYHFLGAGHHFQYFDQRLQQVTLQTQELNTIEGITVKTTAVGLYRIVDPIAANSTTADYTSTLYTLIQLALRDAISGIEAEILLSNIPALGPKLLAVVQVKAFEMGLELTELVVRDVILPADIKAALSEAWRSKKAALAEMEVARGKTAVARTLANSAKLYEDHPLLLKIRCIEALEQASKSMGNTFVIGLNDSKISTI